MRDCECVGRRVCIQGTEYAFMSTTLDRNVAEMYAKGSGDESSIIFQMSEPGGM
eukprot:SAG11_NODE_99_length_16913_cov_41.552813_8_plen_54_part_00